MLALLVAVCDHHSLYGIRGTCDNPGHDLSTGDRLIDRVGQARLGICPCRCQSMTCQESPRLSVNARPWKQYQCVPCYPSLFSRKQHLWFLLAAPEPAVDEFGLI